MSVANVSKVGKFLSKKLRPNIGKSVQEVINNCVSVKTNEVVEDLGYKQRQLLKPKVYSPLKNDQGFNEVTGFGKSIGSAAVLTTNENSLNRKCFIYQKGHNHMQSTPDKTNSDVWTVEVTSESDCRHNSMLWNKYGNDAYTRWGNGGQMSFTNLESAIEFVKLIGWEYEVLYTGVRYHQTKSYADNFLYSKPNISDVEENDIKFDRI